MAGIRIEGNISGNVAEVANGFLQVVTPLSNVNAGYVATLFENDPGFVTGVRYRDTPYVSKPKRLSVGMDTILGSYYFTSTAQNTGDFKYQTSTMTMTQTSGYLNINPTATGGSAAQASLQTWKYFTLQGDFTIAAESQWAVTSNSLPVNQFFEWGFFVAPASGPPVDGVFFRLTGVGITGVLNFGGVETESAVLTTNINLNQMYRYKIMMNRHTVSFWRDDILLGEVNTPTTQHIPFQWTSLPLSAQMRNSAVITTVGQVRFGMEQVTLKDLHTSKPWGHQMAGQGKAYQGQNGDTQGQLSVWVNTTAPTSTVLTNTSGAFTGLGGVGQVTVTTLAAGTDGIIFSYQNPVPTVTQPGKTLFITGITIQDVLSVALGTSALIWTYAVAYGHTAVSLATTEVASFTAGATKSPRRIAIGSSGFPLAAAIGTQNNPINVTFQSPIVVNPGEFFAILAKQITTVPTAGSVVVTATVDHYFE